MFYKTIIATALVTAAHASPAFEIACQQDLNSDLARALPTGKSERVELDQSLSCRWTSADSEATGSVLFSAPASESPVEIEIATKLDADDGTTATHIAMLDASFEPVGWIPFRNFRERKGYVTARFFINPADPIRYILVGGAASAADTTLTRTYEPVTTSLLNFAGLVTAYELEDTFEFNPSGEIRVSIRKPQKTKVEIIP